MRPIIGITTYVEPATWGVWRDLPTTLVPHDYTEAVTQAGGRPVLIPPHEDTDVLGMLDGLVLAGGPDLSPGFYGAEPEPLTVTRPDRDRAEILLVRRALELDVPLLGVCRGMQLLVVANGGTLHQHLPDVLGHERHRPAPGVYGEHDASLVPGSRIAGLMGDELGIRCFHHQGVADAGKLTVTGHAADGLPEAVEDPGHRFVLGVQWHPEVTRDERLFGALVAAARQK
ncbi:gamma-glutamyl-gamma-aminobutyrate hydrolase family protein [Actinoplanes bogorensis]|uniref:Gamma-glutamyl-gamma-aminobutyrate hydrolase family protein n=1 Tax=Paractinoplanes bogorensis TaxID=1610840 RepID=A0ABS5YFJ4_9ACTN|nr:gamma-glutamyl-gamma-aminobutyrate hydrolase family protein [Actinoplanes bogorensis]MBU2662233.1 gamma-glutamyl-gamma-aminobutyrate hydrolase family protein [Actinoplanes bogorensis]